MGAEEVAAAAGGIEAEAVTGLAIVGDVALAAKDAAGVRAIGVEAEAQRRSGDVELGQPRLAGAGSLALPAHLAKAFSRRRSTKALTETSTSKARSRRASLSSGVIRRVRATVGLDMRAP